MSNQLKNVTDNDVQIYGKLERQFVNEIDRVADQMLMPRSWVVTQIIKQWVERRQAEILDCEESWNGSYREQIAQTGEDECVDPGRQIAAA